jgi:hypothetical protein
MRIGVRSRAGNAVLGIIGVLYAFAALALLATAVSQTWSGASLIDHAVKIMLIGSAVAGVLLAVSCAQNLGLHLSRRATPPGPEGAAAAR